RASGARDPVGPGPASESYREAGAAERRDSGAAAAIAAPGALPAPAPDSRLPDRGRRPPRARDHARRAGGLTVSQCADRQVLMNFLRSAPLRFLLLASTLQVFIFSCCVVSCCSALASPERQVFMNSRRSAPFLLAACALQSFIRCCCEVRAPAWGARNRSAATVRAGTWRILLIPSPFAARSPPTYHRPPRPQAPSL